MKWRRIYNLGAFHKEAARRGLTYAEAQTEGTCRLAGPVRAPGKEDPEHPAYQKVSTRNMLRKRAGSK